jgi:N utilization substance protein B
MARRSRAREVALQLLYQTDRNPESPVERIDQFVRERLRDDAVRQFASELIAGVQRHRDQLDETIESVAENWSLHRMTPVDRNILRVATFEILHRPDTPPKVAIDEAVELAKRFGTEDSQRFVNGLLDRIVTKHARPAAE